MAIADITNEQVLTPKERAIFSALPTRDAQRAYLVQSKGIPAENLKMVNGEPAVYDPEKNTINYINPRGFEMGDIGAAVPSVGKAALEIAGGIGGSIAGGPVGSVIVAGLSGAGAEALSQKLATSQIKTQEGESPNKYFNLPAVRKEALRAAAGQAGGELLGKGIIALQARRAIKSAMPVSEGIEKTLPASKIFSRHTGLQDTTIRDISENPYVRKKAAQGFITENVEEYEREMAESLKKLHPKFKELENNLYKQAGVTDQTPVNIIKPVLMKGEEMPVSPVGKLQSLIEDFGTTATTDEDLKALKDATGFLNNISKSAKGENLEFGQLKKWTQKLYDNSQNAYDKQLNDVGNLFSNMRKTLTETRNAIPGLKQASSKFSELSNTNDVINDLLHIDPKEINVNVAKRLKRRYKDVGNTVFKDQLDALENYFKSSPETMPLTDLTNKIKTYLMGLDVTSAKSNPFKNVTGIMNLPVLRAGTEAVKKVANPERAAHFLAKNIDRGLINPGAVTREIPQSSNVLFGKALSNMRAYGGLLPKSKIAQLAGQGAKTITTNQPARTATVQTIMQLIRGNKD